MNEGILCLSTQIQYCVRCKRALSSLPTYGLDRRRRCQLTGVVTLLSADGSRSVFSELPTEQHVDSGSSGGAR